jgi:hypothetical protein
MRAGMEKSRATGLANARPVKATARRPATRAVSYPDPFPNHDSIGPRGTNRMIENGTFAHVPVHRDCTNTIYNSRAMSSAGQTG